MSLFKELKTDGDEKKEAAQVEYALFFVAGERVILLHAVGLAIEGDLDAGLDRCGEAGPWHEIPKEDGLWIWEGTPGWTNPYNYEGVNEGSEPIYEKRGKARRPTEDELKLLVSSPIEKLFGEERWPPGYAEPGHQFPEGTPEPAPNMAPMENPDRETQEWE